MHNQIIKRRRHTRCLWNACRAASAAIILFMAALPSAAQGRFSNGLSADSVNPYRDSVFIALTKAKMDEKRARLKRPIVALVLSGGGAKGAAEVGAIKYLEEQGIPIDMVCGTSIGGMIGGMIATGYKADDVHKVFTTQDWGFTLTDRVGSEHIPYATKMYNRKYLLSIPFSVKDADISTFESKGALRSKASINALTRSLPSGYAYGLNVNNLISSLTVGYHDDIYFADLPVPYASVAADMVTSKAKYWGSGSLQAAMRSTMSIPGLFDPVRRDEMVLVDGGTRNNFPTDLAKAMGADFIIGIDLSDVKKGYSDVTNIGTILFEFISMLGADSFNANIVQPDVFIKPSISEFNMLSFSTEAIDTMFVRGYSAALEKADDIASIKEKLGDFKPDTTSAPRAINLAEQKVLIESIEFYGVSERDAVMLKRLIKIKPGDMVGKAEMDYSMARLQATGSFDNINYSMYGTQEPFKLVYHCTMKSSSLLGISARMDTEEWASIRASFGLNTRRLTGPRFEFETKLGQNLEFNLYSSYASSRLPTINFDWSSSRYKGDLTSLLFDLSKDKNGIEYWSNKGLLYLTDIRWTRTNFKFGARFQSVAVQGSSFMGLPLDRLPKDRLRGAYIGAFASWNIHTLNDPYYPTKGISLGIEGDYDFAKVGMPGFHGIWFTGLNFKGVIPIGKKFAFIPEAHVSNYYGNQKTDDVLGRESIFHMNFIGGAMAGRYHERQVPFFAIDNVALAKSELVSLSLEARYNPVGKLFVSLMGGAFNTKDQVIDLIKEPLPVAWGAGMELGYDSFLGPMKLNVHWSDLHKWGLYISMGYDF